MYMPSIFCGYQDCLSLPMVSFVCSYDLDSFPFAVPVRFLGSELGVCDQSKESLHQNSLSNGSLPVQSKDIQQIAKSGCGSTTYINTLERSRHTPSLFPNILGVKVAK
jgi:hypothetical protein